MNKPFHNECLDLYKDYAKKLIEEELEGKEEVPSEEKLPVNEEKPSETNPIVKKESLRSSIRKKEAISTQKVSFQDPAEVEKEKENEKNNDNIEEVKLINTNLAPQLEMKIRNSIRLLENDIKTLDLVHVCFFLKSLQFKNKRKNLQVMEKQVF